MNMNHNTSKLFVTVGAAFALVFGVFMASPAQAHAFSVGQLIDPACFFACDNNGGGGHNTRIVNNYGNFHSPGGTVVNGNVTTTSPAPYTGGSNGGGNNNYYYTNYSSAPSSPTYSYNYNPAPVYTYGSTYSYYSQPSYQPVYSQPVYYSQPAYTPVYVSCSADTSYATVGSPVTWSAYASGGNGYYTYSWSGTDGFYGNGQYAYYNYQYPGYKTASVTVYSNGQTYTQGCSNGVSVSAPIVYAQPVPVPVYRSSNYNGLDVGCYADPSTASVNQPVTWNVEVTGGAGPYSYSWTGTDGLTGSAASIIKYYSSAGSKNAVVTVTSADGRNAVHACSNTVTVKSKAAPAPKPVVQTVPTPPQPLQANPLPAASFFSLAYIPWGWVSVLVILVLLGAVLYLIFNKSKI